jgi:hypothetical protein
MLTIDHHVQSAFYKFNREMKHLNQGEGQVPCQAGQPSKDSPDVDCPEMVNCHRNFRKEQEILKRSAHKRPSKHTALNGSLMRRGVLFARATLSSSLSTEEKFSRLSIGTWIPYHRL